MMGVTTMGVAWPAFRVFNFREWYLGSRSSRLAKNMPYTVLTKRLIKQGFWYSKLSVSFKKFSRRHSMLFNKYAVSVKRHIREGICIPLDVKPDLVRNITTRNSGCGQCA